MSEVPCPALPAIRKLYVVRRKDFDAPWHATAPFTDGRMEGTFSTRAAAEAFLDQREEAARASGDYSPLNWYEWQCGLDGQEDLLALTDFDPPVFFDWLEDAGISRPPATRYQGAKDLWLEWLGSLTPGQLTRLYEGLHRFSFHEILEIDWIDGDFPEGFWTEWDRECERLAEWEHQRLAKSAMDTGPDEGPGLGTDGGDDIPF
jgi:hypothetical protein